MARLRRVSRAALRLACLGLWLAAFPAPSSADPRLVDNSGLLGPCRDQGDIGSCHCFSMVALAEGMLKAHYGVDVALSEADVFVAWLRERARREGRDWSSFWEELARKAQQRKCPVDYPGEEGSPKAADTLDLILERGAAFAGSARYDLFAERYLAARRDNALGAFDPDAALAGLSAAAGPGERERWRRRVELEREAVRQALRPFRRQAADLAELRADGRDRRLSLLYMANRLRGVLDRSKLATIDYSAGLISFGANHISLLTGYDFRDRDRPAFLLRDSVADGRTTRLELEDLADSREAIYLAVDLGQLERERSRIREAFGALPR